MRVVVDWLRCEAHGVCSSLVPDVFSVDDGDTMHLLQERPSEALWSEIEKAIQSCPRGALRIEEGS
jgi:ferredoxin